jgi:hypothetical protein
VDQVVARVAEQLGFQTARIWPQVVMVTWVTSLFWAIADPLIVVAAVVGIVLLARRTLAEIASTRIAYDKAVADKPGSYAYKSDYDAMGWTMTGAMGCLLLAFVASIALSHFPDQLAGALYPEATTILRIAKGLK